MLMPESLELSDAQLLTPADIRQVPALPGDSLFVVGYPYGYSTLKDQPAAIVLTRSVAAVSRDGGRRREILIDGGGAPGMSGGPVFYLDKQRLYLLGLYTGILYPDAAPGVEPERTTALGTVCSLYDLHLNQLARPERLRLRDIKR
jgi:S1-C subfamily serine protease